MCLFPGFVFEPSFKCTKIADDTSFSVLSKRNLLKLFLRSYCYWPLFVCLSIYLFYFFGSKMSFIITDFLKWMVHERWVGKMTERGREGGEESRGGRVVRRPC